ncbi:hypothetical protein DSO57_1016119 [Entomophthora muscae]|uniref:Uncharacterized protein n=1 Tax=Entomophthora muscae TaxID=34485 RepID=A0ACC2SHL2_9FUNG|nr:hypothetical protein DSO57_1016119 [Entomophthora muscae]
MRHINLDQVIKLRSLYCKAEKAEKNYNTLHKTQTEKRERSKDSHSQVVPVVLYVMNHHDIIIYKNCVLTTWADRADPCRQNKPLMVSLARENSLIRPKKEMQLGIGPTKTTFNAVRTNTSVSQLILIGFGRFYAQIEATKQDLQFGLFLDNKQKQSVKFKDSQRNMMPYNQLMSQTHRMSPQMKTQEPLRMIWKNQIKWYKKSLTSLPFIFGHFWSLK